MNKQKMTECDSSIERNEVLKHTTTWIDFENIMLKSQLQKTKYYVILCI